MKCIKGYEGMYEISEEGKIWSYPKFHIHKDGRWLKTYMTRNGYEMIVLSVKYKRKHFLLHRLVAESFIPNPRNLPQVNHKNGIKTDNRVSNLEWSTNQENRNHAVRNGLHYRTIPYSTIIQIRKDFSDGVTRQEIAKSLNINWSSVDRIVKRKSYIHI